MDVQGSLRGEKPEAGSSSVGVICSHRTCRILLTRFGSCYIASRFNGVKIPTNWSLRPKSAKRRQAVWDSDNLCGNRVERH